MNDLEREDRTTGGESVDERERRLALNEAIARDVNELVDDVAETWFRDEDLVDFRCECVQRHCVEPVRLTREEYTSVRDDATTFVVTPGHEDPELEEIIGHIREYPLVRKLGAGRDVAVATDPRTR
jgi:hypothetical protein